MSESKGRISSSLTTNGGYSAAVRLRLTIGGRTLPLGQVGHDRIILDESEMPVEPIEATTGEVWMSIDGIERRWPVRLATPLSGGRVVGNSRIISLLTT